MASSQVPVLLSEELVCYQRAREIHGVDPMTGKDLWVRQDMPPGCTLFGDDQYLFVVRQDQQQTATVLRAGRRPDARHAAHPGGQRLGTLGRYVLHLARVATLELWDPWEQRAVWSVRQVRRGAASAGRRAGRGGDGDVAVPARTGRFTLVRIADGRKLIDAKCVPKPSSATSTSSAPATIPSW